MTLSVTPAAAVSRAIGGHVVSIQVLRGVAAALVMLYHGGTLYAVHTDSLLFGNGLRAGFIGVDVFFVLSGFLIYGLNAQDFGCPERCGRFLLRRCIRILPLYWLVVLSKAAKDRFTIDAAVLLPALLLLPYPLPPFINVSWTLTFEMLFYAAFALMILMPRGVLTWLPVAGLLLLALLPAPMAGDDAIGAAINFLFDSHIAEFVMGAAACHLAMHAPRHWATGLCAIGAVGMLAFLVAGTLLAVDAAGIPGYSVRAMAESVGNPVLSHQVVLIGLPCALLLAGAYMLETNAAKPWRSSLGWLGDISYSLYLTHGFVIHFVLSWAPFLRIAREQPLVMLPLWAVCILVGGLVHVLIERPLIAFLQSRLLGRTTVLAAKPAVGG